MKLLSIVFVLSLMAFACGKEQACKCGPDCPCVVEKPHCPDCDGTH